MQDTPFARNTAAQATIRVQFSYGSNRILFKRVVVNPIEKDKLAEAVVAFNTAIRARGK